MTTHAPGCDERHASRQRCNADAVVTARLLRIAVLLELVPALALATALLFAVVAYATGSSAVTGSSGASAIGYIALYVVFYCGGLGWILAGRDDIGSKVLVGRAAALLMATFFAVSGIDTERGIELRDFVGFAILGTTTSAYSALILWRFGMRLTKLSAAAFDRRALPSHR